MTDSNLSESNKSSNLAGNPWNGLETAFALDITRVIDKYRSKAWTKAKEDLKEITKIMDAVIRKYTQGKFSLILEETPSIPSNVQFGAEHIHFSVAMVTKPTIATHDTDWVHVGYISHFKVRHDGEYPILFQTIPINSREELVVVAVVAFRDPKSKLISLLSANWVEDGKSRR